MSGSAAEREIRDAVADFAREQLSGARIVHELPVGGCRADLAAVEEERLTLFEIKSERDTLSRLERQVRTFSAASHETIVVAHSRWFERFTYNSGGPGFRPSKALAVASNLWHYPRPMPPEAAWYDRWTFQRRTMAQPHAARLLDLLWKAELLREAADHGLPFGQRATCPHIATSMAWNMTGREIARAVCRQLRRRQFPEADPPV